MKDVKKKASSRLNIIKKLASTSWGADKNTLRNLYLGYVRSTIDYGLALQNISSQSTQESVDKVQNNALRFISGAMKSTPSAACEIHTNVEPLNIRREAAAVEMTERYRRLNLDNPNRKLTESPRPEQRLKKMSILSISESLKEKYPVPEERKPICIFNRNDHPNTEMKRPIIKQDLIEKVNKKDTEALHLLDTALSTINNYPDDYIHIYTDGSATNGTSNAGCGSLVQFPDGTNTKNFSPCGKFCSNFEAEAVAMTEALNCIDELFTNNRKDRKNVVVFTDAKSVLQALEGQNSSDPEIRRLSKNINKLITTHAVEVFLQWIPGHSGIFGNERADALAKLGASCLQTNVQTSFKTVKQIVNQKKREIWMNQWSESEKGRSIYEHMAVPNKNDSINKLRRQEQVTIFRLRSQHIQLNKHLVRIGAKTHPACPLCQYPEESVTHHLFNCPHLDDLRIELLPPNPDINNTLYGTAEQLKKTHTYHVMAKGRRAQAQ